MPTPNQMIGRLRQMLDDEVGLARKWGSFYSDAELVRHLDISQDLIVLALYEANCLSRLQNLFTPMTVAVTTDVQTQPLPADYCLPVRAEVGGRPARLYNGGEAAVFEVPNHYGALLEGMNIVWKGARGRDATLWYIRRPTTFAVNPAVARTELDLEGYDLVLYHAAVMAGSKEQNTDEKTIPGWRITRYKRYFESLLRAIVANRPGVYPMMMTEDVV